MNCLKIFKLKNNLNFFINFHIFYKILKILYLRKIIHAHILD